MKKSARLRDPGLIKRLVVALLLVFPVYAASIITATLQSHALTQRLQETVKGAVLAARRQEEGNVGYLVFCEGGCSFADTVRMRYCAENAWIIEENKNWQSAKGYFFGCLAGEGFAWEVCPVENPECLFLGRPSSSNPWRVIPSPENLALPALSPRQHERTAPSQRI